MTKTRYRPICEAQFSSTMAELNFKELRGYGMEERVYGRRSACGPQPGRFAIAVLSTVDKSNSVTRECGADAIRVVILDTFMLGPDKRATVVHKMTRVHRTENALTNMRARVFEARNYLAVGANFCPSCMGLMVERRNKGTGSRFMGCTNRICTRTRPMLAEPVSEKKAA